MKALAVIGSPRGMVGNTGRLLDAVLKGVRRSGVDALVYSLADLRVEPCRGCGSCHQTGTCSIEDDFRTIADAAQEAGGVILASPNYMNSVSAQMKAFLDRCCGPLHCQAWESKYGAAVVSSGGSGAEEVEGYLLRFLRNMGCWTVGSVSAQGRQLADESAAAQALRAAADLGGQLARSTRDRAALPEQVPERQAFMERMRQLVTMQKENWPFEYAYWKSRGRL